MRFGFGVAAVVALALGLAPGGASARLINCVEFARQASSVVLSGDAWTWWGKAQRSHETGAAPEPGAVLVFERTPRMRRGHVAVVREVIDRRTLAVDHANWGSGRAAKGKVARSVRVEDASPENDWTAVRVWHEPSRSYGFPYPTYGFIYETKSAAPRRRTVPR